MANGTVNIAILGHRFMGRTHSNAWSQATRFFDPALKPVLKVVCGRDIDELQQFADRWGWEEIETDWKRVIERDDIDVIDIALPTYLHAETAIAAAEAGKHVFCEKPMANSLAESEAMLTAAESAGIVHYLNHNYRRCPAVVLAKQLIDEGRIGDIYHWRGAYQQSWLIDEKRPIDWKLKQELAAAGPLWDLGSHAVDLAHYLVGSAFKSVTCHSKNFITDRPLAENPDLMGKVDVECAALMTGEFENGALATIETTRYATGRRNHHTFEISGSKGALAWDMESMNRLRFYDNQDDAKTVGWRDILVTEKCHDYANQWWPPGHIIGYEHTFVHSAVDFLNAIASGEGITPNFEDGVQITRVLEAARKSAESGMRIEW